MDFNANKANNVNGMRLSLSNTMQFWVYVKAGEKVHIGTSSIMKSTDVSVTQPNGATTNYNVTPTSPGYIANRNKEVSGPTTLGAAGGYTPITVTASSEGLMKVVLYPSNAGSGLVTADWRNFDTATGDYSSATINAWGIFVTNSSGANITGRVFSSNLLLNDTAVTDGLVYYVLTNDGYLYVINSGQIKGFYWGVGGSNLGYKHRPTGKFVYSSVVINNSGKQSIMPGIENFFGYNLVNQNFDYSDQDYIAYRTFLYRPDADLRNYLGISTPKSTPTANNFKFEGNYDGNETLYKNGGVFSFDSNADYGTYELQLVYSEKSGQATTQAMKKTYTITSGGRLKRHNEYVWDGKDARGNFVPVGEYTAVLIIKAGEIHLIYSDIEEIVDGIYVANISDSNNSLVYYNNTEQVIGGHSTHLNEYLCTDSGSSSTCSAVNMIDNGNQIVDKDNGRVYLYTPSSGSLNTNSVRALKSANGYTDGLGLDLWTYYRNTNIYRTEYIVVNPVIVQKVWNDQNNKFNSRPSSLIFDAYNGNTLVDSCTANSSNSWKCSIDNLPDGVTYTIRERTVPNGYTGNTATVVPENIPTVTITNNLETKNITVTKSWSDQDNKFSTRPSSIIFDAFIGSGTTSVGSCTANASNSWKCTISNLAKVDSAGRAISYTIKERTTPSGYTGKTASVTTESGTAATISNTLQTKNITVTKTWDDQNNKFSTRSASIIFDAFIGTGTTSVGNCTANASNSWKCTISNLAKVDSSNKPITYTVKERTVPSGYTQTAGSVTTADGTTATVKNTLQTKDITVTKTWSDQDNKFSTRPASLIFDAFIGNGTTSVGNCTANASNSWKCTISNLAKVDSANKAISYTIKERTVPSGYTQKTGTVTAVNGTAATVTNTLETKNITVTKSWSDQDNKFNTRPSSIIFDVFIGNGTTSVGNCTANAANSWKCTISNLAKLDSAGEAISYTVKERTIPSGYTQKTGSVTTADGTAATVTNTLETKNITVTKSWSDQDNKFSTRPSSIIFDAFIGTGTTSVGNCTANASSAWKCTISNLAKVDSANKAITYTVKERTVPSGYTQKTGSVTTADGTAATVTNTLQTKNITVTKTWVDQDNKFSTRPASIIFDVFIGNGTTSVGSCTANASNSWKCTISNLAKLDTTGKAISYTVKERTTPTGYKGTTSTVSTEDGTTAEIKNTLETVSLTVVKQWDDDNNRDNYRVSSISFDVYAGKEKQSGGPYTISERNSWKTTVSGLPKYNSAGKEIVYSVQEIRDSN